MSMPSHKGVIKCMPNDYRIWLQKDLSQLKLKTKWENCLLSGCTLKQDSSMKVLLHSPHPHLRGPYKPNQPYKPTWWSWFQKFCVKMLVPVVLWRCCYNSGISVKNQSSFCDVACLWPYPDLPLTFPVYKYRFHSLKMTLWDTKCFHYNGLRFGPPLNDWWPSRQLFWLSCCWEIVFTVTKNSMHQFFLISSYKRNASSSLFTPYLKRSFVHQTTFAYFQVCKRHNFPF